MYPCSPWAVGNKVLRHLRQRLVRGNKKVEKRATFHFFFFQRKGKGIYCFMELRRALSFFLCSWKAGHILPQNARFTAPHGELHGHRSGVSCLRLASNNYVTPLMRICNAILSSYCFYLQHHFCLGLTLFIYFRLTVWMASLYCSPQRPHI